MISSGTNRCVIIVVLAAICAPMWAAEPDETPIQLAFEISSVALGPFRGPMSAPGQAWHPFAPHEPAYAAAITLVYPWVLRGSMRAPAPEAEYLPGVARGRQMSEFLTFAEQQAGLSERQKAFLGVAKAFYEDRHTLVMDHPEPNEPGRLLLYGMTLEDAQKMAQAYFQYAMNEARRQAAPYEGNVRRAAEDIAGAEKRLSGVDKLIETTQKSLEDFQKTVPYRSESEAHQAIGELDRMLNAAQVEIAGIKARMTAIQGYQQEKRGVTSREITGTKGETARILSSQEQRGGTSQEALARLDMMFIEESIALQGAGARERMATRLREQANRFIDLKSTLASASGEKTTLTKGLDVRRRDLRSYQGMLEAAKRREPRLPDKVIIHPVKWVDDAPDSN